MPDRSKYSLEDLVADLVVREQSEVRFGAG
jgi:hypothetical protein